MPDIIHKNFTGADAVHPAAFVQSSDPGAVGANLQWIDTSSGPPYTLRLRNAANTAWLNFAAGATGSAGPTGPTGATGPTGPTGAPGIVSVTVTGGQPYICIQDQKPSGTSGGTFTAGSYVTRTLNTIVVNDLNLATLDTSANRITLPAGTYRVFCRVPAEAVQTHQARLQSITGGGTIIYGSTAYAGTADTAGSDSIITGRIALRASTIIEVQHRSAGTRATQGFGVAGAFGNVEIYTSVEFWLVDGPPPFFGSTYQSEDPSFELRRRQSAIAQATVLQHSLNTPPQ